MERGDRNTEKRRNVASTQAAADRFVRQLSSHLIGKCFEQFLDLFTRAERILLFGNKGKSSTANPGKTAVIPQHYG